MSNSEKNTDKKLTLPKKPYTAPERASQGPRPPHKAAPNVANKGSMGKPTSAQTVKLADTDLGFALLHASWAIGLVSREGKSLDQAISMVLEGVDLPQARGAVADLSYFGMRWLGRGRVLTELLTGKKNLRPAELEDLLALCFALLWDPKEAKYTQHAVVDQAVQACASDAAMMPGKGLVNACLRNFLRDQDNFVKQALQNNLAAWNFPNWWVQTLRKQHPDHWQDLLRQGNEHPPMVLRVNQRCMTGQAYLDLLTAEGRAAQLLGPQTVLLDKPCPVFDLPGFAQGEVSVQDSAAQMAARLLNPQSGQLILDACAAPGGKTGHLLELADVDVVALDDNPRRLARVRENFERLQPTLGSKVSLELQAASAESTTGWWDGTPFDHILADLPCSGSGVVRRHPDIRWLRRQEDVAKLSQTQQKILDSLWSTLKPGGTLLVVTCSIFLEEGPLLAQSFADRHSDAEPLAAPGVVLPHPQHPELRYSHSPDGFFYAHFSKKLPL
ncbi:MAG: 16S rRNA (cytosine(967)-C(5))-methyltransferase RsmB [Limnobacter sp.]|nr:16S rRNA (cytosine(967)-C(5))-methyltransferase RsmB [Limnobacter sp.]